MTKTIEALSRYAWPVVALVAFFFLLPSIKSIANLTENIKVEIAGQKIELKTATTQQQKLIDDLNASVLEIKKNIDEINSNRQKSSSEKNSDDQFTLYEKFSGDDLKLQISRKLLGERIAKIIEKESLSDSQVNLIQQLIISQHNSSTQYQIGKRNADKHRVEIDRLYRILTRKLVSAPSSDSKGRLASALGIMMNNMKSLIESR